MKKDWINCVYWCFKRCHKDTKLSPVEEPYGKIPHNQQRTDIRCKVLVEEITSEASVRSAKLICLPSISSDPEFKRRIRKNNNIGCLMKSWTISSSIEANWNVLELEFHLWCHMNALQRSASRRNFQVCWHFVKGDAKSEWIKILWNIKKLLRTIHANEISKYQQSIEQIALHWYKYIIRTCIFEIFIAPRNTSHSIRPQPRQGVRNPHT